MTLRGWLACLCVLAPAPAFAGPDAGFTEALILGGGKTRADADAWMTRWQSAARHFEVALQLAAGFPRVVESATVPGLKPGFHIVVMGFCPFGAPEDPRDVMKLAFPGLYTKTVEGVAPSCPSLKDGWKFTSLEYVEKDGHSLNALKFEGAAGVRLRLFLTRRDQLVEAISLNGEARGEAPQGTQCTLALSKAGGKIVVESECGWDTPGCGNRLTGFSEKASYGVEQGKIGTSSKRFGETHEPNCGE